MSKLTIRTDSLTSDDSSIQMPTEIHVYSDGRVMACHAGSGDSAYDSVADFCVAYNLSQDAVEMLINEKRFGAVEHDGKTLVLEQEAYIDQDFTQLEQPTVYRATARDAEGNRYRVQWALKPEIAELPINERPEDESEYCDWSSPESVTLTESAC